MNKITYGSLGLKPETTTEKIIFHDKEIEVLQYLDAESKYDLIMITLQKAQEGKIFNSFKIDIFFHLHLVYMYTNISFTEKQQENDTRVYDCLKTSGLLDKIIEKIPESEYEELRQAIQEQAEMIMSYNKSAGGVVNEIITDLPVHAQAAADIVKNFDKTKYQEVIDFAKAANGGREISENGQN